MNKFGLRKSTTISCRKILTTQFGLNILLKQTLEKQINMRYIRHIYDISIACLFLHVYIYLQIKQSSRKILYPYKVYKRRCSSFFRLQLNMTWLTFISQFWRF